MRSTVYVADCESTSSLSYCTGHVSRSVYVIRSPCWCLKVCVAACREPGTTHWVLLPVFLVDEIDSVSAPTSDLVLPLSNAEFYMLLPCRSGNTLLKNFVVIPKSTEHFSIFFLNFSPLAPSEGPCGNVYCLGHCENYVIDWLIDWLMIWLVGQLWVDYRYMQGLF